MLATVQEIAVDKTRSLRSWNTRTAAWNAHVDALTEKIAGAAEQMQSLARNVFTVAPCFYHYHPDKQQFAVTKTASASERDHALCRLTAMQVGDCQWDPIDDAQAIKSGWVKVAYSPTIRRVGEALNFFPSSTWMPNSPGPVQSMLTTGLVGAGLGYGAGWLGEKLMPGKWEKGKLRTLLAALGGGAGMVPGALWGLANVQTGKKFWDPSLTDYQPGQSAKFDVSRFSKQSADLAGIELSEMTKVAIDRVAQIVEDELQDFIKEGFTGASGLGGPLAINTQTIGQVLWDVGAKPEQAAMTMGTLHAAQQMPGGEQPGFVTPAQMARLGAHMGAGYLSGALVGSALGILTGLPQGAQDTLKSTGAYMGILNLVVPKLFG